MGLDQFAVITKEKFNQPVDFKPNDTEEFHYWRKHPDLHGWMETLYFAKGGTNPDFNCAPVEITNTDLDRLEADVLAFNLPKTEGFFFGASVPDDAKDDLAFIAKARTALTNGDTVFYYAWW